MGTRATFNAVRKSLTAIRDFVETKVVELGADHDHVYDIAAAVDEAACNVIIHGYGDQGGILEIEVDRQGNMLIVYLRDQAPVFDPTTLPTPDITQPLEERPIGGMGVHIMRQHVDEIQHRSLPGGGNELILKKGI